MRLGEALALQWGDIDFRSRFVEVRRNYIQGKITRPKNGKSRRVDMSRYLAEVLQHLQSQAEAEEATPRMGDPPRVGLLHTDRRAPGSK